MKTTKTNKNNEIQIGDKVKFVVGTSLLTGVITKFYKNSYGDEECSVKTELNTLSGKINQKIFPHILLHRVSKIEGKDEVEVVREMRQQIVDLEQENKQLKEQIAEKDKEIEELKKDIKSLKCANELYSTIASTNATKMNIAKQIRKQVCDEIREKLKAHCNYTDEENIGWYLTELKIVLLIDQIEKIEQAKESMK